MPSSEPPVPIKPAPWTTKCTSYWMMLNMRKLPEGVYAPLEASSPEFADPQLAGEFKGGLGMIMVVRYEDTPAGPYDELLLIPGVFQVPNKPTPPRNRITRIYVSQPQTCHNGRHNWNIPKHLARFRFSSPLNTSPLTPLTLAVYPPNPSATTPFFSATLTPFRWLPAVPLSTRYLPLSTVHAQPPLPAAPPRTNPAAATAAAAAADTAAVNPAADTNTSEADATTDTDADTDTTPPALLCGTAVWRSMPVHAYSPAARGMWVTVHAAGTDPWATSSSSSSAAEASEATAEASGAGGQTTGTDDSGAGLGGRTGAGARTRASAARVEPRAATTTAVAAKVEPGAATTAVADAAVAGAARWWPAAVRPWRVGLWMERGTMEIPAPEEWKL